MMSKRPSEMAALCSYVQVRPITEDEKRFLEEFIQVMKPLAMSLDVIQGNVSVGYLIPTLRFIIDEWKTMSDLQFTNGLVSTLSAAVQRRFHFELKDSTYKIAAALHPRFKLTWLEPDELAQIQELIRTALAPFELEHNQTTTTDSGKLHLYTAFVFLLRAGFI